MNIVQAKEFISDIMSIVSDNIEEKPVPIKGFWERLYDKLLCQHKWKHYSGEWHVCEHCGKFKRLKDADQ